MREIKVQQLSYEAFRKYGVYQDLTDDKELAKASVISEEFFADLVTLDFGKGTLPTISVCQVFRTEKNIVDFIEVHSSTCEGLLPLDGDVIIFVGTMALGQTEPDTNNLEAFYVPKGTFVKLDPLIIHGTQYPVNEDEVHIVCMLPGRTFYNDTIVAPIMEDERKAEIVI